MTAADIAAEFNIPKARIVADIEKLLLEHPEVADDQGSRRMLDGSFAITRQGFFAWGCLCNSGRTPEAVAVQFRIIEMLATTKNALSLSRPSR